MHIPVSGSQHAPLHCCVPPSESHAAVHCFAVVSHAVPLQSPLDPQPHMPPPVVATQLLPMLLPAQLTQAPPFAPHAVLAVTPVVQTPALQQPPLHCCGPPSESHAVVHWWVVVLHAMSAGQSVVALQPQALPLPPP